jgi:hypothetical protein
MLTAVIMHRITADTFNILPSRPLALVSLAWTEVRCGSPRIRPA